MKGDPRSILSGDTARILVGLDSLDGADLSDVEARLSALTRKASCSDDSVVDVYESVLSVGNAALDAFLQVNVTGPPPDWDVDQVIPSISLSPKATGHGGDTHTELTAWLSVDGEAVYQRIPHVQLLVLAKIVLNSSLGSDLATPETRPLSDSLLARLRVNTWHQRLLSQTAPSLQRLIYHDLQRVEEICKNDRVVLDRHERCALLIEEASIHILHGFDTRARKCLQTATEIHHFDFVLTGRLGKRTKFQVKDTSQLVVLAKSFDPSQKLRDGTVVATPESGQSSMPEDVRLEDDTLLSSIAFTDAKSPVDGEVDTPNLPPSLSALDPSAQPILDPLDSIILLATASIVTTMSPVDELSREETLPYAERALSGGSSNWQIYTQALLVRSRIEGYKTRTIERGVLQLQAVVDQVIAEITSSRSNTQDDQNPSSTFLPRADPHASAPVSERLQYIHQLATPPRWKLEAELAERWVSLGGLRTALEIYERLGMWAEVALCWASSGQEDKARRIIRDQLYHDCKGIAASDISQESSDRRERDPLPADAPRLFCILGDIDMSISAYERAWELSKHSYARAQRSLGKMYLSKRDLSRAEAAYILSLQARPQDHPTWFALGCVRLQTENWPGAVEAFGRAVQIEDTDAESWSNLAVSLLRLPEGADLQQHRKGAFVAMKKATALKRDNAKLWQNLLAIAIQLSPPPYTDIVMTQSRLIDLLGKSQGESIIDVPIVEALLQHVFTIDTSETPSSDSHHPHGYLRLSIIDLITKQITPLITSSRSLWLLVAKLNIHLKKPLLALSTYEKAWRSCLNQPGWETNDKLWLDVTDATIDLVDAYESLGEQPRESGLGEGEVVCRDWKFKARSAVRSTLARAKGSWEGDERLERLQSRLDELKNA